MRERNVEFTPDSDPIFVLRMQRYEMDGTDWSVRREGTNRWAALVSLLC